MADLAARRVPVVWTAHNLTPHEKRPDVFDPIYQLWAEHADASDAALIKGVNLDTLSVRDCREAGFYDR